MTLIFNPPLIDKSIIANKQTFVYTTDAGVTMSNDTLTHT